MIQFQESVWTEGRMEGQDGQILFIGPFRLLPGSEN